LPIFLLLSLNELVSATVFIQFTSTNKVVEAMTVVFILVHTHVRLVTGAGLEQVLHSTLPEKKSMVSQVWGIFIIPNSGSLTGAN
jgi:hypothetical protein